MGETRIKQICLAFPVPQRCVALALTVRDGYGFTYRNAMSVVRREIKLSDLGISEIRPRRAVTGGLIFETAGHLYIVMDVTVGGAGGDRLFGSCGPEGSSGKRRRSFPRWAAIHRDEDLMTAAAMAVAWAESLADEETEAGTARLRRDLQVICDSCMPRSGAPRRARAVFWWFEEIAHLREACIRPRRRYTRSRRRRRGNEATVAHLYGAYREARRPLQQAIKEAKRRAWD
jgi:hypothetical protein